MYNRLTSFVIPIGWSIISGITGQFHRNMHFQLLRYVRNEDYFDLLINFLEKNCEEKISLFI
jgi:hypothetical protein